MKIHGLFGKWILLCVFLLGFSVLNAACQPTKNLVATSQATPKPLATPQAGKTSISGKIISQSDGKPLSNVVVRLAQVYRQNDQGAFVLDVSHSPGNFTQVDGTFLISDFEPAEYFIVVGEPEKNNYYIVQDKNGKPVSFTTEKNKITDVGELKADYVP
jgi:hypothetical protein